MFDVSVFQVTLYRVRTDPGKPGKSWNFVVAFFWENLTGPGKFWRSVKLK